MAADRKQKATTILETLTSLPPLSWPVQSVVRAPSMFHDTLIQCNQSFGRRPCITTPCSSCTDQQARFREQHENAELEPCLAILKQTWNYVTTFCAPKMAPRWRKMVSCTPFLNLDGDWQQVLPISVGPMKSKKGTTKPQHGARWPQEQPK